MKFNFGIFSFELQSDMFQQACRFILVIYILLLVSCESDNEIGINPSIQLKSTAGLVKDGDTIAPGTLMNFQVELNEGSEKITNFYIEVLPEGQDPIRYFDTALYISSFLWSGSFYKSPESSEQWTFVIRDRRGGQDIVWIKLYADTTSIYNSVKTIAGIEMGAQGNAVYGQCYSLSELQSYALSEGKENQEKVDLVFYYGEDELTIASPGANIEDEIFPEALTPVNWEIRNTTRFIKTALTTEQFNAITNDSTMIALYIDADGKRKAKNLAAGDVFIFKTQQSLLGLFHVNEIAGTTNAIINIDIKLQEAGK